MLRRFHDVVFVCVVVDSVCSVVREEKKNVFGMRLFSCLLCVVSSFVVLLLYCVLLIMCLCLLSWVLVVLLQNEAIRLVLCFSVCNVERYLCFI